MKNLCCQIGKTCTCHQIFKFNIKLTNTSVYNRIFLHNFTGNLKNKKKDINHRDLPFSFSETKTCYSGTLSYFHIKL